MSENEANKANFEELMGHVTVLKARLENAITTGNNAPQASQYDDLFDYYERAVKDRVMRNATLMEEYTTLNNTFGAYKQSYRKLSIFTLCLVLGGTIILCMQFFPNQAWQILQSSWFTHASVAIMGAAIVATIVSKPTRLKQS